MGNTWWVCNEYSCGISIYYLDIIFSVEKMIKKYYYFSSNVSMLYTLSDCRLDEKLIDIRP